MGCLSYSSESDNDVYYYSSSSEPEKKTACNSASGVLAGLTEQSGFKCN